VEKAFIVHLSQKKIKFENDVYVFIPNKFKNPDKMSEKFNNVQLSSSVKENARNVTLNQFERATKAGDFYHAIGTPFCTRLKGCLTHESN
jgi:hypothetical protein